MPRLLRLVLSLWLFAAFIAVVLSPQIGFAVIPPPGYPAYSQDCPSSGPSVCPPQHLPAYSFSISLTEGNVANETSVAQVRAPSDRRWTSPLSTTLTLRMAPAPCLWGQAVSD